MNPLSLFAKHEANGDHNVEFRFDNGKLRQMEGKEKVGFRDYIGNDYLSAAKRRHRQQNPIAANQADIVYWAFYDRFFESAGGTMPGKFSFFTVPQGQTLTANSVTYTKTKQVTNMTQVS